MINNHTWLIRQEQRNKEYIINNGGIPLIIDCLSSDNEDILTSAITILIFLLTPPTLEIARTCK